MDAFAAAVWFALTALVICAAWTIARRTFPGDGSPQRIMHTLVLVWTWIVVVSFALGAFGVLNAISLGGGVLIAATASWFWSGALKKAVAPLDSIQFVKGSNSSGDDLAISDTRWGCRVNKAWNVFWTGTAALGCAMVIDKALLQFPSDWDTLMYHRPLIDHWIQTGSLYTPQCAMWFVPGNNELLGLWWAAAFSGDFWVGLMSIPSVILLALGIYELARLMDLTPLMRHATVIAVVGSSIVSTQITNAKNDVAVAGLFVLGLAYGFRYLRDSNRCDLSLCGAALGLTAGVKYYALGYGGVGWLAIVVMIWRRYSRRTALVATVTLAGIMMLTGAYWYGRNLVATGTPLYPQGYSGPQAEESQMSRSAWGSSILGNRRPEVLPQYVNGVWKRGGICQTAAVFVLPFSLSWLLMSSGLLVKRNPNGTAALRLGLAIALMGAWLIFMATPFTVDAKNAHILKSPYILSRFSQAPLTLSTLALALLLSDVSRWINTPGKYPRIRFTLSAVLPMVFATAALGTLCANAADTFGDEWFIILLIATNSVLLSLMVRELFMAIGHHAGKIPRIALLATLAGGMTAFVVSTTWLGTHWHANFAAHYDQRNNTRAFSKLEKWDGAPPSIVALDYRYYPFFGSRRQFQVYRPRLVYSKEFLFSYLISQGADIVVVINRDPFSFGRYRGVSAWIEEHPDIFSRVDSGRGFTLFRIEKDILQKHIATTSVAIRQSAN